MNFAKSSVDHSQLKIENCKSLIVNCKLLIVNYTLLILGLIIPVYTSAQVVNCGISPHGVVLHYEGPLPSGEITLLKDGKAISTLKLKTGEAEIEKALKKAETLLHTYPKTEDSLIHRIPASLKSAATTEGIFNKYLLTVKMAVGLAYIDEKGLAGSVYTAQSGDTSLKVVWSRKEAVFKEPSITPYRYRSWYGRIETSWKIDPANPLLYTRLFRKNHDSLYYHLVPEATFNTLRKGDTIYVLALDTTLPKLSYYHYQMAGYDFYGNPTRASNLHIADNLDNSTLPVVTQFTALENEEKTRVAIRWKINHSERVKSALLFRSFKSDRNFTLVTQVPPGDTVYYDEVVNPMEAVFYKLVLYDLKGLMDHAPVVPLVSKQQPDALPPADIRVVLKENKPVISWVIKDLSARGFYVYRTDAIGTEPVRASGFIDADTSIRYQWADTSRWLEPGKTYHYAVISDSRGYVKSAYSDFVSVDIPDNRPLRTPHSVVARTMEADVVLVAWNTQGPESEQPEVYNVYRAATEEGPYTKVNRELIFLDNFYTDTLRAIADSLFYTVTSVGPDGRESARSLPYRVQLSLVPWGIRNIYVSQQEEDGIEISWPTGDPEVRQVEIHRVDSQDKSGLLKTLPCETGRYVDKTAKPGQVYGYRLVSINRRGEKSQPGRWVMVER